MGFHNDSLYETLRPCVPLLVGLLKDPEEKTRANAAGALGNFVRNSPLLSQDLIKHGALESLLMVVTSDSAVSPRRISLFSIGNCCTHPECKRVFEDLKLRQYVEPLIASKDQQLRKFATRIIQKLNLT
eukprot:TRINITY_DN52858_c0_g1_i1.p2 TRINITY_DN52858_c0_g1~~TRINITY_DN52858_c0_g1_i1.p2  ORF type:complete len:129 (-),score=10.48 TRINITY_DN52858_c0_g1_i1:179-565(-)